MRVFDRPGGGWGWSRGRLLLLVWIGAKISHLVVVVDVLLLLWCDENNKTHDQISAVRHKSSKNMGLTGCAPKKECQDQGFEP